MVDIYHPKFSYNGMGYYVMERGYYFKLMMREYFGRIQGGFNEVWGYWWTCLRG